MAKKNKDKDKGGTEGVPLGGEASIGGLGSISSADRVAQVRAVQAMSPFAAVSSGLKVDVGKDFQLSREPFEYRSTALRSMAGLKQQAQEQDKGHWFGQHVEGLTFTEKGAEKDRHKFFGEVNTGLYSAGEVLRRQGGFYEDGTRFRPPKKGTVE